LLSHKEGTNLQIKIQRHISKSMEGSSKHTTLLLEDPG